MDNIYQIYSSDEKLNFLLQKIDSLTKDVHVLKQQLNKLSSHSSNQSINSIKHKDHKDHKLLIMINIGVILLMI